MTGDAATGCGWIVYRISGITKTGLAAIPQSNATAGASGVVAETTFDASALIGNPVVFAPYIGTNSSWTDPAGWTSIGAAGNTNRRIQAVHWHEHPDRRKYAVVPGVIA